MVQETRLFDPNTGTTRSMRSKEEAHDYRYFPDPDLVPLVIDEAWVERTRDGLPELPERRRQRFMDGAGSARLRCRGADRQPGTGRLFRVMRCPPGAMPRRSPTGSWARSPAL